MVYVDPEVECCLVTIVRGAAGARRHLGSSVLLHLFYCQEKDHIILF
jgi:hypothetical protein